MSIPAKILVLEDDEKLRTMLCQVFLAEGYQAEAAASGLEAISMAATTSYDLVLADIRMEGVDGLEALARMKESQPDMRSLVMTGYSTEADSIRAIRLGVGDYLQKPFNLDDLLDSVQRLLTARRRELEKRAQESLLRRSLLRAVEAVARSLDLAGLPGRPAGGLLAVGARARALAQGRGLSAEVQEEVHLAAAMVALTRCGGEAGLVAEEDELPPSLRRCLRHVEERWDGQGMPDGLAGSQIPLESRLVAVALAGENLSEAGRFDPELVAGLKDPDDAPATGLQSAQLRGLLSLAQALEAAGQSYESLHAYQQICAAPHHSREWVESSLGLARLAANPEEALHHCQEAVRASQAVGPGVSAQAALESGLLLASRGLPGEFFLQQAGRLYRELQFPSRQALATLALAAHGSSLAEEPVRQSLDILARAEFRDELGLHVSWLAPWLLTSPWLSHGSGQRIAQRLLGEARLSRLLRQGKLNPAARSALLTFLENGSSAPAVLQALVEDPDPSLRGRAQRLGQPAQAATSQLRIYTLGPLEVYRGDERIPNAEWRSQKGRYIFAYLCALAGRQVSEDVLIDLFWPDDAEKGKRSLYWVASILRSCLRAKDAPEGVDYILRHQGMLSLNPDLPRWHDLEQLEALTAQAAQQQGVDQAESLRRAVNLYRGSFLEGCYMDWVEPIRERVFRATCDALLSLASWALQVGRAAESLEHANRLLELDPCRQDGCLVGMQALQALGRSEEAVRLFERCRKALRKELEMEPGVPLLEAQQRALLSLSK